MEASPQKMLFEWTRTEGRIERRLDNHILRLPGTEVLADGLGGSGSTDYIYASGLRVASVSGGPSYPFFNYYHADALGSVRLVAAGGSGFVMSSSGYLPFGQDNGRAGGFSQTYRFRGKPKPNDRFVL